MQPYNRTFLLLDRLSKFEDYSFLAKDARYLCLSFYATFIVRWYQFSTLWILPFLPTSAFLASLWNHCIPFKGQCISSEGLLSLGMSCHLHPLSWLAVLPKLYISVVPPLILVRVPWCVCVEKILSPRLWSVWIRGPRFKAWACCERYIRPGKSVTKY